MQPVAAQEYCLRETQPSLSGRSHLKFYYCSSSAMTAM